MPKKQKTNQYSVSLFHSATVNKESQPSVSDASLFAIKPVARYDTKLVAAVALCQAETIDRLLSPNKDDHKQPMQIELNMDLFGDLVKNYADLLAKPIELAIALFNEESYPVIFMLAKNIPALTKVADNLGCLPPDLNSILTAAMQYDQQHATFIADIILNGIQESQNETLFIQAKTIATQIKENSDLKPLPF